MLLRNTDPFRDFDRLTQQLLGTTNRPVVMPMDAWREGDRQHQLEPGVPEEHDTAPDQNERRNGQRDPAPVIGVPAA